MKKVLSVVLALAIVLSCASMFTIFAATVNENLLSEKDSTFTGAAADAADTSWTKQGGTPVLSVVDDPIAEGNKVLQCVTKRSWESPRLNIAPGVLAAMKEAGLTEAMVEVSMRAYIKGDANSPAVTKSLGQAIVRTASEFSFAPADQNNNCYMGIAPFGKDYNTWYNLKGNISITAEDFAKFEADTTQYINLCMDSMNTASDQNPVTLLVDDVCVKIVQEAGDKGTVKVVNGNAEEGMAGWSTFMGGEVAQVSGGANGTAHAMEFTPNKSSVYQTIAFDLGPAIIQDEAAGYKGAGAGEYTLTFWAKADAGIPEGQNTKFKVVLNSKKHVDAKDGVIAGVDGDGYVNSYITTKTVAELSKEWKQFEAKITISEAFLKTIKALYDSGAKEAYELVLRLDGAGEDFAFGVKNGDDISKMTVFKYFVDEVAIYAPGQEVPGQGGEATDNTPKGVTVKVTSADEGAGVYVRFSGYQGHMKDGKISVKIHNTGKSDVTLILESRKDDNTWTTIEAGKPVTIAPNKVATLTVSCPIEDGAKLPFMLIKIEGAKAGDSFTVYGFTSESIEANKPISTITTAKDGKNASLDYGTTTMACPTGDAAPIAMVAVAAIACAALGLVVAAKKKKENA